MNDHCSLISYMINSVHKAMITIPATATLLLHIPHFHHHKDGGGPIQMGVDQIDRYACRYSIFCCLTRMGVDLSKWGWTKWIGMPVDIPFSAVYLGSFLFPFVSEKIFHCKPNLAQSLNLYSTHCVDNLSCP